VTGSDDRAGHPYNVINSIDIDAFDLPIDDIELRAVFNPLSPLILYLEEPAHDAYYISATPNGIVQVVYSDEAEFKSVSTVSPGHVRNISHISNRVDTVTLGDSLNKRVKRFIIDPIVAANDNDDEDNDSSTGGGGDGGGGGGSDNDSSEGEDTSSKRMGQDESDPVVEAILETTGES